MTKQKRSGCLTAGSHSERKKTDLYTGTHRRCSAKQSHTLYTQIGDERKKKEDFIMETFYKEQLQKLIENCKDVDLLSLIYQIMVLEGGTTPRQSGTRVEQEWNKTATVQ